MDFKEISIRGRMAYLLCVFEKILVHFNCEKKDWSWVLERLWQYTCIEYLDDWMYEIAEYMPESVMEDNAEEIEFITQNELKKLKALYVKNTREINKMLRIIYELGTIDLYSRLQNGSPNTLEKLQEGIKSALQIGIELPNSFQFKIYKYSEGNGWGIPFDGRKLSLYL